MDFISTNNFFWASFNLFTNAYRSIRLGIDVKINVEYPNDRTSTTDVKPMLDQYFNSMTVPFTSFSNGELDVTSIIEI